MKQLEKAENLVRLDRHSRKQDMTNIIGISYDLVESILKDDLGVRHVCAKI